MAEPKRGTDGRPEVVTFPTVLLTGPAAVDVPRYDVRLRNGQVEVKRESRESSESRSVSDSNKERAR